MFDENDIRRFQDLDIIESIDDLDEEEDEADLDDLGEISSEDDSYDLEEIDGPTNLKGVGFVGWLCFFTVVHNLGLGVQNPLCS